MRSPLRAPAPIRSTYVRNGSCEMPAGGFRLSVSVTVPAATTPAPALVRYRNARTGLPPVLLIALTTSAAVLVIAPAASVARLTVMPRVARVVDSVAFGAPGFLSSAVMPSPPSLP